MKEPSALSFKRLEMSIDQKDSLCQVAHALSSRLRVDILRLAGGGGMSVNELSRALNEPVSTVALNVEVLRRAGLIHCESQKGARGTIKLCTRRLDEIHLNLSPEPRKGSGENRYELPVGCFSAAGDIRPTCGMVGKEGEFGMDDNPIAFFHPRHFQAQLIWMRTGYVEYCFPAFDPAQGQLDYVEVSFEACSEAPGYRNEWPSDICCWMNGRLAGVWRCPGDFGGRRGRLNPAWWGDGNSQHGQLVAFRVTAQGSLLNGGRIGNLTLSEARVCGTPCVTVRVGVGENGGHAGGLNLFGECFGDHAQGVVLRYGYHT